MDYRGNMSGQHRRSKINHSVIFGPELTEAQQRIAKSRKRLVKMNAEELALWLEVCKANLAFWKNRRTIRNKWQTAIGLTEKQIACISKVK